MKHSRSDQMHSWHLKVYYGNMFQTNEVSGVILPGVITHVLIFAKVKNSVARNQ